MGIGRVFVLAICLLVGLVCLASCNPQGRHGWGRHQRSADFQVDGSLRDLWNFTRQLRKEFDEHAHTDAIHEVSKNYRYEHEHLHQHLTDDGTVYYHSHMHTHNRGEGEALDVFIEHRDSVWSDEFDGKHKHDHHGEHEHHHGDEDEGHDDHAAHVGDHHEHGPNHFHEVDEHHHDHDEEHHDHDHDEEEHHDHDEEEHHEEEHEHHHEEHDEKNIWKEARCSFETVKSDIGGEIVMTKYEDHTFEGEDYGEVTFNTNPVHLDFNITNSDPHRIWIGDMHFVMYQKTCNFLLQESVDVEGINKKKVTDLSALWDEGQYHSAVHTEDLVFLSNRKVKSMIGQAILVSMTHGDTTRLGCCKIRMTVDNVKASDK